MTNYQLIWILPGSTTQDDIDASIKRMEGRVKHHKGKTQKSHFWEQRSLAFPIKKQEVGNYCVATFAMDSANLPALSGELDADTSILRFLISKT